MRWNPGGEQSQNIEDRRGAGMGGRSHDRHRWRRHPVRAQPDLRPRPGVAGPAAAGPGAAETSGEAPPLETTPEEEAKVVEIGQMLDDLELTWAKLLGGRYQKPTLVLFRGATPSACGMGESAMGPFYCPGDRKVYLDLEFFDQLDRRFGAPGDFAQAYVIAHEVGHHVQNLLGIERQVRALQQQSPREANALSVLMELQADCFAGVWGHSTAQRGQTRRRRCRRRPARRIGDRRRRVAAAVVGACASGEFHARVRGATRRVAQAWPGDGRRQVLRHLQGWELTYKLLLLIRGAREGYVHHSQ